MNSPAADAVAEGKRRLRAAVRALLSRGVWCVVGAQLLLFVLWSESFAGDAVADRVGVLALAFGLAAFLYLTAGVSQALANTRDAVGLRAALRAGVNSYGPFLWMIAKLALLCGLLLNLVLLFSGIKPEGQPPTWSENILRYLPLAEGMIAFVFVYWLPIVFVRRNFALFDSLRAALVTGWERLPRAAYPAFLTLTPAMLTFLTDASTPLLGLLVLNLVGGFMDWIAYIFCVEWLQDTERT
jgi:hypothetical protein